MKQKTLPLLLVSPFVIAILSVLTIRFAVNIISEDIVDINWIYRENEGLKLNNEMELRATPVGGKSALDDPMNELVWTVANADIEDETQYATLEKRENHYYLSAKEVGFTIVTVKNLRGTVAKSFNAHVYDEGVILLNMRTASSLGIESNRYIGQYDLGSTTQKEASFALDIDIYPENLKEQIVIKNISSGITFASDRITINDVQAKVETKEVTFGLNVESIPNQTFRFKAVKDGYNVYNYDELLQATNSGEARIVVQQVHFESLENTYDANGVKKYVDTELFGHYNFTTKQYAFDNEVYRFTTTYNHKYIDDWNVAAVNKVSNDVVAGLHIQKDYYGNGFKLNGHNLTFPYERTTNSEGVTIATLGARNLFRGPKTFVALGDPSAAALVRAYGQDNTFLYVEGDDITLRDVNVRNADFGNNMNNLEYTGTGIDILGNNITLVNSQVRNARNTVRVYSSMNAEIRNSFIGTARQALIAVGTNEFVTANTSKRGVVYDANGSIINSGNTLFSNYFNYPTTPITLDNYDSQPTNNADGLITKYLLTSNDPGGNVYKAMRSLDNLINQVDLVKGDDGKPIFKTELNIVDTYFYQSGIAAIMIETMFNGPFLYNGLPSIISSILEQLNYGTKLNNVGGISYPSKVNLIGETRFYDYKDINSIDVNSIIGENISEALNSVEGIGGDVKVTVDDIFPIRRLIESTATANGHIVFTTGDGVQYKNINVPIIYYGGGVNLSTVDTTNLVNRERLSSNVELDLLKYFLSSANTDTITAVLRRSVLTATGFNNFKYHAYTNAYLYGENPEISNLRRNISMEV